MPAAPLVAVAQEGGKQTATFAGTYALRFILGEKGLRLNPRSNWAEIASGDNDPANGLLIVLGPDDGLPAEAQQWRDADKLADFVARGGAVFIATDHRTPAAVQTVFGLRVSGDYWHTQDRAKQYRQKLPDCPLVLPHEPIHPVFAGLANPVATNVPSYLERPTDWPRAPVPPALIARLPRAKDRTWSNFNFNELRAAVIEADLVRPEFAAAFQGATDLRGAESRVLVVADDSVFIDGMMLQRDISNFDFAWNCVDWLTQKPNGRRENVLFLDHGTVVTDLSIPANWKVYPPLPLPPDLMTLADKVIAEGGNGLIQALDTNNALGDTIQDNVPRGEILRIAALVGTVGLGLLGSVRLWRACYRFDATVPLFTTALQAQAPARTTLDGRHQAMVDEGNLWEAARDAALQCLDSLGPAAVGAVSRVTVAGPWRARWRLRWQLYQLGRLAHGKRSRRISRRGFRRVLRWCGQVQEARAAGKLRVDKSIDGVSKVQA
jgi:hypothetical protein